MNFQHSSVTESDDDSKASATAGNCIKLQKCVDNANQFAIKKCKSENLINDNENFSESFYQTDNNLKLEATFVNIESEKLNDPVVAAIINTGKKYDITKEKCIDRYQKDKNNTTHETNCKHINIIEKSDKSKLQERANRNKYTLKKSMPEIYTRNLRECKKHPVSECTEIESVTFRPKVVKTKEEIEQEFKISIEHYEEEEIFMTSRVRLKKKRPLTYSEEAAQKTIKITKEIEQGGPTIEEIIDDGSDTEELPNDEEELEESFHVPLKRRLQHSYSIHDEDEIAVDFNLTKNTKVVNYEETLVLTCKTNATTPSYDEEEVSLNLSGISTNSKMKGGIGISYEDKVTFNEQSTYFEENDDNTIKAKIVGINKYEIIEEEEEGGKEVNVEKDGKRRKKEEDENKKETEVEMEIENENEYFRVLFNRRMSQSCSLQKEDKVSIGFNLNVAGETVEYGPIEKKDNGNNIEEQEDGDEEEEEDEEYEFDKEKKEEDEKHKMKHHWSIQEGDQMAIDENIATNSSQLLLCPLGITRSSTNVDLNLAINEPNIVNCEESIVLESHVNTLQPPSEEKQISVSTTRVSSDIHYCINIARDKTPCIDDQTTLTYFWEDEEQTITNNDIIEENKKTVIEEDKNTDEEDKFYDEKRIDDVIDDEQKSNNIINLATENSEEGRNYDDGGEKKQEKNDCQNRFYLEELNRDSNIRIKRQHLLTLSEENMFPVSRDFAKEVENVPHHCNENILMNTHSWQIEPEESVEKTFTIMNEEKEVTNQITFTCIDKFSEETEVTTEEASIYFDDCLDEEGTNENSLIIIKNHASKEEIVNEKPLIINENIDEKGEVSLDSKNLDTLAHTDMNPLIHSTRDTEDIRNTKNPSCIVNVKSTHLKALEISGSTQGEAKDINVRNNSKELSGYIKQLTKMHWEGANTMDEHGHESDDNDQHNGKFYTKPLPYNDNRRRTLNITKNTEEEKESISFTHSNDNWQELNSSATMTNSNNIKYVTLNNTEDNNEEKDTFLKNINEAISFEEKEINENSDASEPSCFGTCNMTIEQYRNKPLNVVSVEDTFKFKDDSSVIGEFSHDDNPYHKNQKPSMWYQKYVEAREKTINIDEYVKEFNFHNNRNECNTLILKTQESSTCSVVSRNEAVRGKEIVFEKETRSETESTDDENDIYHKIIDDISLADDPSSNGTGILKNKMNLAISQEPKELIEINADIVGQEENNYDRSNVTELHSDNSRKLEISSKLNADINENEYSNNTSDHKICNNQEEIVINENVSPKIQEITPELLENENEMWKDSLTAKNELEELHYKEEIINISSHVVVEDAEHILYSCTDDISYDDTFLNNHKITTNFKTDREQSENTKFARYLQGMVNSNTDLKSDDQISEGGRFNETMELKTSIAAQSHEEHLINEEGDDAEELFYGIDQSPRKHESSKDIKFSGDKSCAVPDEEKINRSLGREAITCESIGVLTTNEEEDDVLLYVSKLNNNGLNVNKTEYESMSYSENISMNCNCSRESWQEKLSQQLIDEEKDSLTTNLKSDISEDGDSEAEELSCHIDLLLSHNISEEDGLHINAKSYISEDGGSDTDEFLYEDLCLEPNIDISYNSLETKCSHYISDEEERSLNITTMSDISESGGSNTEEFRIDSVLLVKNCMSNLPHVPTLELGTNLSHKSLQTELSQQSSDEEEDSLNIDTASDIFEDCGSNTEEFSYDDMLLVNPRYSELKTIKINKDTKLTDKSSYISTSSDDEESTHQQLQRQKRLTFHKKSESKILKIVTNDRNVDDNIVDSDSNDFIFGGETKLKQLTYSVTPDNEENERDNQAYSRIAKYSDNDIEDGEFGNINYSGVKVKNLVPTTKVNTAQNIEEVFNKGNTDVAFSCKPINNDTATHSNKHIQNYKELIHDEEKIGEKYSKQTEQNEECINMKEGLNYTCTNINQDVIDDQESSYMNNLNLRKENRSSDESTPCNIGALKLLSFSNEFEEIGDVDKHHDDGAENEAHCNISKLTKENEISEESEQRNAVKTSHNFLQLEDIITDFNPAFCKEYITIYKPKIIEKQTSEDIIKKLDVFECEEESEDEEENNEKKL